MAFFNTSMGQMTEMSQQNEKNRSRWKCLHDL